MKKKWIFLFIFVFVFKAITYWSFGYRPEKPFNRPYFTVWTKTNFFKTKLSYIYDKDEIKSDIDLDKKEKDIIPKSITIKTINIFGAEKVVVKKENPHISSNKGKDSIFFNQIPFFTKEIVVTTLIELYGEKIIIERKFYPYFIFGVHEFWYLPFPFLWESMNGKVLFKWGYL